jgi:hypothetical protein
MKDKESETSEIRTCQVVLNIHVAASAAGGTASDQSGAAGPSLLGVEGGGGTDPVPSDPTPRPIDTPIPPRVTINIYLGEPL